MWPSNRKMACLSVCLSAYYGFLGRRPGFRFQTSCFQNRIHLPLLLSVGLLFLHLHNLYFYICTICIFTFVQFVQFTVLLPTYFPHYSALIGPRDGMLGNLPNNLNTTWLYFGLNRSKSRLRIHDLFHPSSGWKHKSNFSTPIALILSAHLKTLIFQLA